MCHTLVFRLSTRFILKKGSLRKEHSRIPGYDLLYLLPGILFKETSCSETAKFTSRPQHNQAENISEMTVKFWRAFRWL